MTGRCLFIFVVAFAWHAGAYAQYTSLLGRFDVDQVKGCAPHTVNVTINAPFVCDAANSCDMDFEGDENFQELTFTYTYTQPGSYMLKILFGASDYDSIAIEVVPNTPPDFDVYTCANNEVFVKINDSNYDEYIINYNDGSPAVIVGPLATDQHAYASSATQTVTVKGRNTGAADNCSAAGTIVTPLASLPQPTITLLEVLDEGSIRLELDTEPNILYKLGIATNNASTFQQLRDIYNTTVDTVFNLKTNDNYYCFQLAALDPCTNAVISSPANCSANLDLTSRNNAIDVRWTTAAAAGDGNALTRTASDGTVLVTNPNASPYADLGVTCGIEYCYRLAISHANGSRSISSLQCATGFSTDTPTAIENITALVGDNSVVLEWQTDPDFIPAEFSIDKSIQGNYSFLATTTQNAFADPAYLLADASCYRIRYKDVCDNQSGLSVEACPVRLTGTLLKDNSINLSWTPYSGWTNGVSGYLLEKYSEDGALLQTFPVGNATTYVDASDDLNYQSFVYLVKAIPAEAGIGQATSNRVAILKDPNLFHPTAFTPNGDNLNDIFTVFGQYVAGFEMKIFNRWGEMLFTTDNIETGWDGTFRGNDMPEGTYTFIAHITDRAGRTFKRSGSVLLLRKE